MADKYTNFLVEFRDSQGRHICKLNFEKALTDKQAEMVAKHHLKKKHNGTLLDIATAHDHHICKSCGGIAPSNDEDLLCINCQQFFGMSSYNQTQQREISNTKKGKKKKC